MRSIHNGVAALTQCCLITLYLGVISPAKSSELPSYSALNIITCNDADDRLLITPTPTPQPTPTSSPRPPLQNRVLNDLYIQREPSAQEYLDRGLGSTDVDCDGIPNANDNCVLVFNPDQKNSTGSEDGDACNPMLKKHKTKDLRCDEDKDGVADETDNCPVDFNPNQKDRNHNGIGDMCEPGFNPKSDKRTSVGGKRLKYKN